MRAQSTGILLIIGAFLSTIAFGDEVRLYTSVDQPVAAKVIAAFEKKTGIAVRMLTDGEATKTAGLAERLRAEKANPRADVWWSNEIFHTIRLADEQLLTAYDSPVARDIPPQFIDAKKSWTAAGIRIRVLISSGAGLRPSGYCDLLNPAYRGKITLAKPAFGTTGGHMAALYVLLGEERYVGYLRGLRANQLKLVGGNSVVAEMVASGQMMAGFTDNDDAAGAIAGVDAGKPPLPLMTIPDQAQGHIGTLAIPCSVALVAGAPHPEAAKQLIDFLISHETEQLLLEQQFIYASVRDSAGAIRIMPVDYAKAAAAMPRAINLALKELE